MNGLKYLAIFLTIVLCAGFASCSSNDDDAPSELIGTWYMTHSEGYERDDTVDETWNETYTGNDGGVFIFYNDGKFKHDDTECTWKYKDGIITINYPNETATIRVLKISSSELILERSEKEEDYEYYDKMTFKKAN